MSNWMNPNSESFFKLIRNGLKFKLFLLTKLPMAFLAGCRVVEVSKDRCSISVPYKWLNQNPFDSTYFAVLAMAGEMSQGVLALGAIYKSNPPIAMIVTGLEAEFYKKAKGKIIFTCESGALLLETVAKAVVTGQGVRQWVESIGRNEAQEVVAKFRVEWSFKVK